jgi:di/tricarboxylate transporter
VALLVQALRKDGYAGLFLAPATLLLVLLLPMAGLSDAGHRLAAVMAAVVVQWVSEALPMAVTALLGPALAVVFQVATARRALASFADPIIFLFIGSFMLAEAMFVHGLDRRIAFTTLSSRLVGASAVRMLVAYGGVATLISMWISNTATTAMLFPIGLSIVGHVGLRGTASPDALRRFAISMMLVTSFAASVGGMATPVGTPPNLIGLGFIARLGGRPVSFLAWTRLGVPLVLVVVALLLGWFAWWGARGLRIDAEGLALVREERARLGPWTRGQRNVVAAFAVAVFLFAGALGEARRQNRHLAIVVVTRGAERGRKRRRKKRPGDVSAQNGWVLYLAGQQPAARCSAVTASDIEPTWSAPSGASRRQPGPPTSTVTDGRMAGTAAIWRASAISGQCAQMKTAQAPPRLTAAASASGGTRAPSTLASIARSARAADNA